MMPLVKYILLKVVCYIYNKYWLGNVNKIMKWINILRKAVKAFNLDLEYYEILKYLPMSLFVVNLVASNNLEKQYAKKCSQSYDKILQKYMSKS